MNYRSLLNISSNELKEISIKSFLIDSEILLSKALDVKRENILLNLEKKINKNELLKFKKILKKRKKMNQWHIF